MSSSDCILQKLIRCRHDQVVTSSSLISVWHVMTASPGHTAQLRHRHPCMCCTILHCSIDAHHQLENYSWYISQAQSQRLSRCNRYDYANKAALDLFQATWDELIGQPSNCTTEDVNQASESQVLLMLATSLDVCCTRTMPFRHRLSSLACIACECGYQ